MNNLKYPILNIKSITAGLSVDLITVKNFLKIDFDNDDNLITKLIQTATTQCETQINKTLIEKTYVYSLYEIKEKSIILPYPPIKSIISIKIIDSDGNSTTVESPLYYLDLIGGIINFKEKPINFYRIDIEYIAGLNEINNELTQALLMHITRMYEDISGYSPIPLNSLNIYKKYKQIKL